MSTIWQEVLAKVNGQIVYNSLSTCFDTRFHNVFGKKSSTVYLNENWKGQNENMVLM